MLTKHLRCAALAAALAITTLPASAADYANPHLLMSADDLAARAGQPDLVIVDLRPAADYEAGHIPGARHLAPNAVSDPNSPIEGALRPVAELASMLRGLGISADTDVVLYDDKGGFHAARFFWVMEYLGHRRASLLNGGIQNWTAQGHGFENGKDGNAHKAGSFAPAIVPRRHASADWILERRDDDETLVIDVRPEKLFKKGHIPWAQNISWAQNLNDDKTMKSADALRAHFEARGVTPDRNIVIHCQNGLASSHSYFALRLLGYPQVRTYHRSWSEWGIADDLPKTIPNAG